MSRYVTPASKHASKIGTLKSGSTALSTASASGLADQRDERLLARRVDRVGREAAVVERRPRRAAGRVGVVVGERAVLEERAPPRDLREGRADAAGPDDENPHGAGVLHERRRVVALHAAPAIRSTRFHRTEVGRERFGHPAEEVHRRRVRRLDVGRDDGGAQSGDRRGHRRGAARHARRTSSAPSTRRRRRGTSGGQDAEGPHGAPARSSPT